MRGLASVYFSSESASPFHPHTLPPRFRGVTISGWLPLLSWGDRLRFSSCFPRCFGFEAGQNLVFADRMLSDPDAARIVNCIRNCARWRADGGFGKALGSEERSEERRVGKEGRSGLDIVERREHR